MKNDITTSKIDTAAAERWKCVRDVIAGDQNMRAGGYLPRLNPQDTGLENIERNKSYRERAVFYNTTGRTLQGLLGLAYRKDPKVDLPESLKYLLSDCDGIKNSIFQQSQASVISVLSTGRHGLYVDYDDNKARPVIKPYLAETVINWRYGEQLELVVLSEMVDEVDGYGIEQVQQYREMAIEDGVCVCRVWRKEEGAEEWSVFEETYPQSAATNGRLPYIPFTFIGSSNNDCEIDPSPLYDLARLNVAHYRNSADYEDSVFFVGQAQPYIAGLSEEWRDHLVKSGTAYIGSRSPFMLPAGGSFGFAQPGANTLVYEAMQQKEAQMISLGARLVDMNAIRATATQSDNDKEASTSVLSMCVANVNEAYQQCIAWCANYQSKPLTEVQKASSFKIIQEYARIKVDSQALAALVSAWQTGVIGKPDVRAYLRSEGVIATERTDELIDGDIELQGPALGMAGQDGNTAPTIAPEIAPVTPDVTAPSTDIQPLIDSIGALVAAMDKPDADPAAVDFTPLAEAIKAMAAPVVNLPPADNSMAQAVSDLANAMRNTPAPIINIAPAAVTVEAAQITVNPPQITIEAPPAANITMPPITLPAVNVTIEKGSGVVKFTENKAGQIDGATLE